MIAGPDSTPDTMQDALEHTLTALDVAAEIDIDRTKADRDYLAAEKAALEPYYDALLAARKAHDTHVRRVKRRLQARTVLGDIVLDRGVRAGKARMKLELGRLGQGDKTDKVFPEDIDEIVDAERRVEPQLVLKVVSKFDLSPDFPGKADLATDLTTRANNQKKHFDDRDAGEATEATLEAALDKTVAAGSDALYKLEKRLLERFPREKRYVRAFFLDVAPARKKAAKGGGGEEGGK